MNIPSMDYGEVRVVRPPGGGAAAVTARSEVIWNYLQRLSEGKIVDVTFGQHKFRGWHIPDELYRTMANGEYSLIGGENILDDERFGGTNLSFLRHEKLNEGVAFELNYPVGLQNYANSLGKALGTWLEDNLYALDIGFKFYFDRENQ